MLHDTFLPHFHFSEKHSILISATPEKIFPGIVTLNASSSWIIRVLLFLRGIPASTSHGMEGWKKMGFVLLDHHENKEIILGLIGQFWKANGAIQHCTADEFQSFNDTSYAKATWNFEIIPQGENKCILQTETRIYCPDEKVRKNFKRYWTIIQPFSGIIRMQMLKAIKRTSEKF
jgi:hypothetical protein